MTAPNVLNPRLKQQQGHVDIKRCSKSEQALLHDNRRYSKSVLLTERSVHFYQYYYDYTTIQDVPNLCLQWQPSTHIT